MSPTARLPVPFPFLSLIRTHKNKNLQELLIDESQLRFCKFDSST